jgi:hypothetical protein
MVQQLFGSAVTQHAFSYDLHTVRFYVVIFLLATGPQICFAILCAEVITALMEKIFLKQQNDNLFDVIFKGVSYYYVTKHTASLMILLHYMQFGAPCGTTQMIL